MKRFTRQILLPAFGFAASVVLSACGGGGDESPQQPAAQTITFTSPGNQSFGSAPVVLVATSTSGLVVSLASATTSVCTLSGTTLTLAGVGTCTVSASQAGNATYAAATPVSSSFTVAAGAQTISFISPGNQTLGTAPTALMATATSGLAVTFESTTPSVCSVSGTALTLVGAGTCAIGASQAGSSTYAPAPAVSSSFTVSAAPLTAQTITFTSPGNQTLGVVPAPLAATSTSGLAVAFASTTSGVCTASGTTLTLLAVGNCSVAASQAGNSTYAGAMVVTQTFSVAAAPLTAQSITFVSPGNQTLGTAPAALVATASSGLTVSLVSTTTGVCTTSGTTLTLLTAGSCTISASQAGNSIFASAAPISNTFNVAAAPLTAQTITFASPGNQTLGTAPPALVATASSGLVVALASTTTPVCTVNGSTLTLVTDGICTVVASQAGNSTFAAATLVSNSFSVAFIELFGNGGFETVGTTTPANAWLAAAGGYTLSTDSRSGTYAAQLASPAFNAAIALQNSIDQGMRPPLVVGTAPVLTFWAKGTAGATGSLTYALRFLDGIGNILYTSNNQNFGGLINTSTYTKITFNAGAVPVGATAAFIEFSQAIGPTGVGPAGENWFAGKVLIDDLSLRVP